MKGKRKLLREDKPEGQKSEFSFVETQTSHLSVHLLRVHVETLLLLQVSQQIDDTKVFTEWTSLWSRKMGSPSSSKGMYSFMQMSCDRVEGK